MVTEVKTNQVYKHYKGNLYRVIALAKHSETCENMVVYSSLDGNNIWVRPLTMWSEIVDDKQTKRFTLIEG